MARIATITLNPAYDLLGFCPKIELGDVNLVKTTALLPAGKGINVAKVLHDLGLTNLAVGGFLGKDNRDGFSNLFDQLKLTDKFHTVEGKTRINVKLTEQDGEVTDLNFNGFSIDESEWHTFVNDSLTWLKDFDMVAISGSVPEGVQLAQFSDWIARVKQVCPKVVFDSSRDALSAGLNAKPWLIKPNDKELEMLLGRSISNIEDIKAAAQVLVKQGVTNVIVSLGSKGALWATADKVLFAKTPKCDVVSTVGAGDSMVAGLIFGLNKHESLDEAFIFASAVAALSVSQAGVGIADMNALEHMLKRIELTVV